MSLFSPWIKLWHCICKILRATVPGLRGCSRLPCKVAQVQCPRRPRPVARVLPWNCHPPDAAYDSAPFQVRICIGPCILAAHTSQQLLKLLKVQLMQHQRATQSAPCKSCTAQGQARLNPFPSAWSRPGLDLIGHCMDAGSLGQLQVADLLLPPNHIIINVKGAHPQACSVQATSSPCWAANMLELSRTECT